MHTKSVVLVLVVLLACGRADDREPVATDTPSARLVPVGRGVALEAVDWGGRGPAIVFLAGLGNTAHVFDEFAPRFTGAFHAIGITRRGFGASATAPPPADLDTLVADITAVLDSLRLDRVVLVGHSIAGEELTRFAEVHGSRCSGLVYLDAAYDRTAFFAADPSAVVPPPAPPMTGRDSASADDVRAYYQRLLRVRFPITELRASSRFDSAGRILADVTPDSLVGRVLSAVRTPNWGAVRCPSLAVYSVADSVADALPYVRELDADGRSRATATYHAYDSLMAAPSRARFKRYATNQTIELRGAHHYVFLDRPDTVSRAMRAFLGRVVSRADR